MAEQRRRHSVLVVDDEPVIVRLLHRLLDDEYVVTDACDGPSAIAAWTAAPVDVIILDQMMPEMSGIEVARHILAEDPGQRILMFTTGAYGALPSDALAVGIRAVLQKTDVTLIGDVLAGLLEDPEAVT